MKVKIWKYQNDIYSKIPQGCVICAQLEQDGVPVDFTVENTIDEAMKAFLDKNGETFPISFSIPKHLPEMMEILGADFLNAAKTAEV
jgi:hypothetical protein